MEEVFTFEGHPDRKLTVWLFTDVRNSKQLAEKIAAGQLQPELALLNASLVPDLMPLHLAAWKALTAQRRGKLVTRTLHSELVFDISGTPHISESFRRFGVTDGAGSLLVGRFDATPADLAAAQALVEGTHVRLAVLPSLADGALLNKYYKLVAAELKVGTVTDAIVSRIATSQCN